MSLNNIEFAKNAAKYTLGKVVLVSTSTTPCEYCHIVGFSLNANEEILIVVQKPNYAYPGQAELNHRFATHPSNILFLE